LARRCAGAGRDAADPCQSNAPLTTW
jgi:hypothetical protein